MNNFREITRTTISQVRDVFGDIREGYAEQSRFQKMRVWILVVFGVDVAATLLYVMLSGGRPLDLEVWFEPGFPSNMLIVKNLDDEALEDVGLAIDGRYSSEKKRIEPGANGFEVNYTFRDVQDLGPGDSYVPQQLEITVGGDVVVIPVHTRTQPPR